MREALAAHVCTCVQGIDLSFYLQNPHEPNVFALTEISTVYIETGDGDRKSLDVHEPAIPVQIVANIKGISLKQG